MNQCTEAEFLKQVAGHEMHVLMDNGIYRHLRFKRPGTGCYHFDLITYPGHLVYSGDMGCYVFARLDDMFQFFRTDREHRHMRDGETLAINLGYWSEKLQAVDSRSGHPGATEFCEDRFRRVINEYRVRWMRELKERGATKQERRGLWEEVDHSVLWVLDSGEHAAMQAARDFSEKVDGRRFEFNDLFDRSFIEYTYHFCWCCYAIAWGVQKYDESRLERIAA